jgi:hypothetical protein
MLFWLHKVIFHFYTIPFHLWISIIDPNDLGQLKNKLSKNKAFMNHYAVERKLFPHEKAFPLHITSSSKYPYLPNNLEITIGVFDN